VAKVADEARPKVAELPAVAAVTTKKGQKGEPKVVAPAPPPADADPASAGRPVRVRLIDGSTVVGQVRAEQPEALVIDCSLGQLTIPRGRISTIAYDAAAGLSSKRAPVQQLDDGDLPRGKK
jgi:hypothetical protein